MSLRSTVLAGSILLLSATLPAARGQAPAKPSASKPVGPAVKTPAAPASLQSTHYPILLLGRGGEPLLWSVTIGQKGPERFDRANYPPIALTPVSVAAEGAANAWAYHANDAAANAEVTIHLTREACTEAPGVPPESSTKTSGSGKASASSVAAPLKYTFRISLEHSLAGKFDGCARIAAELFPKIVNQSADTDDDTDKPKPPVATVTKFTVPTATAFLNPSGKLMFIRGSAKKIVPGTGAASDLAMSHDGKKLLFTRNDAKMGSDRTIALYEFDSGKVRDLVSGTVREPAWSLDDAHIAYLQSQDQKWRVMVGSATSPETASALNNGAVEGLDGWVDTHTLLARDGQSLYWVGSEVGREVGNDKLQQSVPLKDIYGPGFQISDRDTLRLNPVNPDLLLVSAKYATPPPGGSADSSGVFLYEIRSRRRVTLSPPDQNAAHGEWSRDGIQLFYTRRAAANASTTYRVFWDGSGVRRYQDGSEFVVGQ